jgi:hypothetical protein
LKVKQFFTKEDIKEEKNKKKNSENLGKRKRDESPQQAPDLMIDPKRSKAQDQKNGSDQKTVHKEEKKIVSLEEEKGEGL